MVDGIPPTIPDASLSVDWTYEQRLNQDSRWALSEGSRHFDEKSAVHTTLQNICKRLEELGIPYAVAGGMALFQHGFRRFTDYVEILVTEEDLRLIHQELSGRGYLPLFERSKNLRDTEQKVRIEFLVAGQYPGDGKQKPVAFPNPADVAETRGEITVVNLPTLVELKLASGMTGADRLKDLADVQELIKLLSLPKGFGDQLNPYVQPKYQQLWHAANEAGGRYMRIWRPRDGARLLKQMKADGATADRASGTDEDYIYLVTTDPEVAKKYDMHDESEFLSDDGSE